LRWRSENGFWIFCPVDGVIGLLDDADDDDNPAGVAIGVVVVVVLSFRSPMLAFVFSTNEAPAAESTPRLSRCCRLMDDERGARGGASPETDDDDDDGIRQGCVFPSNDLLDVGADACDCLASKLLAVLHTLHCQTGGSFLTRLAVKKMTVRSRVERCSLNGGLLTLIDCECNSQSVVMVVAATNNLNPVHIRFLHSKNSNQTREKYFMATYSFHE
jgi:hypothetical protein